LYVLGQRFSGPEDVNLSVAVADRGDPIEQGALMKYVVKLTNHHAAGATPGFGNATSVTASLALPAGLDFVAASGRHWNCSGTGPVSCLYDVALAPGAVSSPLSLEGVSPGSTNAKKVTATLAADQFDSVTADNSASRTTHVTPSSGAFGFTDLAGAAIGTLLKSNVVTLSGLAGVTPISIASTPGGHGATYSVNGGAFTSAPGSVAPGDQLRLRVRSASAASTAVNVVVDVGGLTEPWDVVTAAAGP
jgi:hypothetical protein